jgi:hypothetical protein
MTTAQRREIIDKIAKALDQAVKNEKLFKSNGAATDMLGKQWGQKALRLSLDFAMADLKLVQSASRLWRYRAARGR